METPIKIATTMNDAIEALAKRAEIDGDEFRVKVSRRPSAASNYESLAYFDEATVEHLANPESWLSKFAGGSQFYQLTVSHAKDRNRGTVLAIFQIPSIAGQPRMPDPKVVKPDWGGPKILAFCAGQDVSVLAPQKQEAQTVTDLLSRASPGQTTAGGGGEIGLLLADIRKQQEDLREERHKMEIDSLKKANDVELKRLEMKIGDLVEASKRQVAQAADPVATLEKIMTVATPLLAAILPVISESRRMEREAEIRRQDRDADRESKRESREVALMERIANQGSETAKVISVFTESLSQTARAMVQTVAMVGELRQPQEPEPSLMDIIKAGVGAFVMAKAEQAQQAAPPAPVQPQTFPAPSTAPSAAPSAAPNPQSTNGTDQAETRQVTPDQFIGMVASNLSARDVPAGELADEVAAAFDDEEFRTWLATNGGIGVALQRKLGDEWSKDPENAAYGREFFEKLAAAAEEDGIKIAGLNT